ncbi:pulmonary surfactant-associated protein d [Plakobranchus ocellatus]|uniref:Pulmonary surfactant-associated protein d n=1 Tax=Plakobranchus ocellatus TaxID=259542 RepID=A0AAV3Y6X1_9GAST|nr:pulmonary surfactant-associated protein d [Plakobranchus ocellatus]
MSLLPILLLFGVLMIVTVQGYANYYVTPARKGRRYHVSKYHEPFNLAKMNGLCKKLGGYLVQIDDRTEFYDVSNAVSDARGHGPFYTGLTDEGSEGRFYNYNDKSPAKDLKWRWWQPDNWWGEHCVEIWRNGLNDLACGKHGRYICEVPV